MRVEPKLGQRSWDMLNGVAYRDAPPPGRWPRSTSRRCSPGSMPSAAGCARERLLGPDGAGRSRRRELRARLWTGEMTTRVGREIQSACGGGTGLGEHACRVLAILGSELAGRAHPEGDRAGPLLRPLRAAAAAQGRAGRWPRPGERARADQLLHVPFSSPELGHRRRSSPGLPCWRPACWPPARPRCAKPAPPGAGQRLPGSCQSQRLCRYRHAAPGEEQSCRLSEEVAPAQPVPVDWKAFIASPEATAPRTPVQIAHRPARPGARAAVHARDPGAADLDLSGQEFAGLLLQVLAAGDPPAGGAGGAQLRRRSTATRRW